MKALLFLAVFAGGVQATPCLTTTCAAVVATDADPSSAPQTTSTSTTTTCVISTVYTSSGPMIFTCKEGYEYADGTTAKNGTCNGTGTSEANTDPQTAVGTATRPADECVPITCPWTCTGDCKETSGELALGATASATALCQDGAWTTASSSPFEACTATSEDGAFTCSKDPSTFSQAEWLDWAVANGFSYTGGGCNFEDCAAWALRLTTLPDEIEALASSCFDNCGNGRRQALLNGQVLFACRLPFYDPTSAASVAQCFEDLACANLINPLQTCTNVPLNVGGLPCPTCPKKSKKGLLGLLGLLGLIPLLLCSSLLCCLLWFCCIRKTKTETDVHFATYDQPAAVPIAVPMAVQTHCEPIHHTSVHHTATVGAPHGHCGVPGVY